MRLSPAVVAWFVKASVFHSVNSAPSANGGSNPAWESYVTAFYNLMLDDRDGLKKAICSWVHHVYRLYTNFPLRHYCPVGNWTWVMGPGMPVRCQVDREALLFLVTVGLLLWVVYLLKGDIQVIRKVETRTHEGEGGLCVYAISKCYFLLWTWQLNCI